MADSYLIDGVGDEVTVMMGIIVGIFIVAVSWMSTRVNDVSFASDIFNRNSQQPNAESNQSQSQTSTQNDRSDPPVDSTTTENSASSPDASAGSAQAGPTSSDIGAAAVNSGETSEPLLRQRVINETTNDVPNSQDSSSAASSENTTIRLKFMDETVKTVHVNPDQTLDSFRRENLPVVNQSRYRLIYRGQVLRAGGQTLRQLNLVDSTIPVVHCFLAPASPDTDGGRNLANSASQQMQMVADELHIGSLLLPILGFCLVCLWYLCIFHTSLFSIQSVVSILGFTLLYFALIYNHFL